jgi:hypothetical protein
MLVIGCAIYAVPFRPAIAIARIHPKVLIK